MALVTPSHTPATSDKHGLSHSQPNLYDLTTTENSLDLSGVKIEWRWWLGRGAVRRHDAARWGSWCVHATSTEELDRVRHRQPRNDECDNLLAHAGHSWWLTGWSRDELAIAVLCRLRAQLLSFEGCARVFATMQQHLNMFE